MPEAAKTLARAACLLCCALAALLALPAWAAVPRVVLDVTLDPATRRLSVRSATEIRSMMRYQWRLDARLEVTRVRLDGRELEPEVSPQPDGTRVFRVPLGSAPRLHRIEIDYSGEIAPLTAARDHRSTLFAMPAMAATEGSFLPSSAHWYPRPPGLFAYEVSVATPAGQRAVAPGRLESESLAPTGNRARFVLDQPSEGIDLMAGPYVVAERSLRTQEGRTLRLRTYFHPELEALAEGYLSSAADHLERHSRDIAPYPFEDFSIVSSPLATGFGMPTLTYLGIQVLKLPFIRDTSLGHEIVHSWWGNGVYPADGGGNWAEGLTTYMADYAYREAKGEGRDARHGWLRDYASLAPGTEQPLASFASRTHSASSAIGYGKSAMLFHMLREEIGPEAFTAGVRAFWRDHRFRVADFAALRASFEQAAGRDLKGFFDQWLTRTGAPALSIASARATPVPGGGARLRLDLRQGEPAFDLRLALRAWVAGRPIDRTVRLTQAAQAVELELPAMPESVQLDPDFSLWRRLAEPESPAVMREVQAARSPLVFLLPQDPALRAAAQRAIERFAEGAPELATAGSNDATGRPVIVLGTAEDIAGFAARNGLPGPPAEAGTGRELAAWAQRLDASRLAMFVSLPADPAAQRTGLELIERRLNHVAAYSWVRFEAGRIAARGIWPFEAPKVAVDRAD